MTVQESSGNPGIGERCPQPFQIGSDRRQVLQTGVAVHSHQNRLGARRVGQHSFVHGYSPSPSVAGTSGVGSESEVSFHCRRIRSTSSGELSYRVTTEPPRSNLICGGRGRELRQAATEVIREPRAEHDVDHVKSSTHLPWHLHRGGGRHYGVTPQPPLGHQPATQ